MQKRDRMPGGNIAWERNIKRNGEKKPIDKWWVTVILGMILWIMPVSTLYAAATKSVKEAETEDSQSLSAYYDYLERMESVDTIAAIPEYGFSVIEDQVFPIQLGTFGETELTFVPAMDEQLGRLVLFMADETGQIVYRTGQLETNQRIRGSVTQPTRGIAAVSFQDVNLDNRKDIVLITTCVNETGDYAGQPYKVGDVLFQGEKGFYRDYRISDKINRFSMNKSIDYIIAYVRDGKSAEFLYTATTLDELLQEDFEIIEEQCYYRNFEKLGRLQVVPGTIGIAEYNVFMIYLVDEDGRIVWSCQPMGDYDNLYALKGMACKDLDGDGMKDLAVLARYSYENPQGELVIDHKCTVYYQRTSGFDVDSEFEEYYQCSETDTMEALVNKIREYWGWTVTND